MGKRLIRYNQKDIANNLDKIIGKEANVVLATGNTIHARIQQFANEKLKVQDFLYKRYEFLLNEIDEIIIDQESPF